jgi:hypothetical protein
MKKFYALVAAALISVAMFASRAVVPSDADLASYVGENPYAMCIYNDGACNDIVLIGTYVGWSTSADLVTFQAVEGFEGWYIAAWDEVPGEGGVQAKPVQLDGSGNFSWDYQLGADAELIRGTASIEPGNTNEVDIKNIGEGIVVIDVKSWKADPCTAVYHIYTVTLVSPDCNEEDFVVPAISGGFNNWAQQAMTLNELATAERQNLGLPGGVFEASFKAAEETEYKFRSSVEWGKDWTNQLKVYVDSLDEWVAFNGGANFVFGEETNLVYDLGDPDLYSWDNCEMPEEEDTTKYFTVIYVNVPAGAPEAGVEIIGTFDSWGGTAMELLNTGWYFVQLNVMAGDEFKFREAGTWNNELVHWVATEWKALDNIKFKDVPGWGEETTYKGTPCYDLEIDLSQDYIWKANIQEGIENVVLGEKAQKVVVDGVLYIIRDNKMYNVQGTQVR